MTAAGSGNRPALHTAQNDRGVALGNDRSRREATLGGWRTSRTTLVENERIIEADEIARHQRAAFRAG